ncbi:MAG: hypothetical protein ACRDRW_18680, partial [Pseudonocardiaceae bacterium]
TARPRLTFGDQRRVNWILAQPRINGARPKKERTVGKHDPTRDGDVHPDTAKQLDPKEFEKSGQTPTDDNDTDDHDDDSSDDD